MPDWLNTKSQNGSAVKRKLAGLFNNWNNSSDYFKKNCDNLKTSTCNSKI